MLLRSCFFFETMLYFLVGVIMSEVGLVFVWWSSPLHDVKKRDASALNLDVALLVMFCLPLHLCDLFAHSLVLFS